MPPKRKKAVTKVSQKDGAASAVQAVPAQGFKTRFSGHFLLQPFILSELFWHLSPAVGLSKRHLKICRLVCKTWSDEAARIIWSTITFNSSQTFKRMMDDPQESRLRYLIGLVRSLVFTGSRMQCNYAWNELVKFLKFSHKLEHIHWSSTVEDRTSDCRQIVMTGVWLELWNHGRYLQELIYIHPEFFTCTGLQTSSFKTRFHKAFKSLDCVNIDILPLVPNFKTLLGVSETFMDHVSKPLDRAVEIEFTIKTTQIPNLGLFAKMLPNLRTLLLPPGWTDYEGIFREFPDLEKVEITSTKVKSAVEHLAHYCKNVSALKITHCRDIQEIMQLSKMQNLRHLSLQIQNTMSITPLLAHPFTQLLTSLHIRAERTIQLANVLDCMRDFDGLPNVEVLALGTIIGAKTFAWQYSDLNKRPQPLEPQPLSENFSNLLNGLTKCPKLWCLILDVYWVTNHYGLDREYVHKHDISEIARAVPTLSVLVFRGVRVNTVLDGNERKLTTTIDKVPLSPVIEAVEACGLRPLLPDNLRLPFDTCYWRDIA